MVMQYLIQRNEEYMKHIEMFTKSVDKIVERLEVLEYNIKELQSVVQNNLSNNDNELKEKWYAKRQRE